MRTVRLVLCVVLALFLVGAAAPQSIVWNPWSREAVKSGLIAKRPVFVLVCAKWDVMSGYNQQQVFQDPEVAAAFNKKKIVALKLDLTEKHEAGSAYLQQLNISVPAYVLYVPGASEPEIFPELLQKDAFLKRMNAALPEIDGT